MGITEMDESRFEKELKALKKSSVEAVQGEYGSARSPPGDADEEQRREAHAKLKEWALAAKRALNKAVMFFSEHRGEAVSEESITTLTELLRQIKGDYMRLVLRADSGPTELSIYRAAGLDQGEQFWELWDPLFKLVDSYKCSAFEKPAPGIERYEFELKIRDLSTDIRRKLEEFATRFAGLLDAFIDL
jgi:hypothetical protein